MVMGDHLVVIVTGVEGINIRSRLGWWAIEIAHGGLSVSDVKRNLISIDSALTQSVPWETVAAVGRG
jgi:hypothetical protein